MRLVESFRMVPVSCHLEVVVKSDGQIIEITSRHYISPLSYLNIPDPPSPPIKIGILIGN